MNNLKTRNLLVIVFSIQLFVWGTIFLDFIGLYIPLIRQLVGLIYLLFVPGVLLLRIFNFNKLTTLQFLLYSVGTSISVLMFTGFFVNMIFPKVGILEPISTIPLMTTFSAIVIILCIFCYLKNIDVNNTDLKINNTPDGSLAPKLLLWILPVLSILGTYFVNYYDNNFLLIFMIFIAAQIILLVAFDTFIPQQLYPLAIWSISISLIFHYTLITNYAGVHDGEFGYAKLVLENHTWKWDEYGNYNSILSIAMLPSIFHFICNINLTWIYKIVFPLILSLIPLGVYNISRIYLNEKMSFLSACIFLINTEFFIELSIITKQMIAILFLVLLYMTILNDGNNRFSTSVISIIFSTSLVVSHYGTSYLVMVSFIFILFILFFTKNEHIYVFLCKMFSGSRRYLDIVQSIKVYSKEESQKISSNFVLLFTIFALSWYIYISNSSVLDSLLSIFSHVWESLVSNFLSPDSSRGMYMLTKDYTGLKIIHKYLKLGVIFLIVIGFFNGIFNYKKLNFGILYFSFSTYYLLLLISSVVFPQFSVMSPGRLYILGLCLLSPLFSLSISRTNFKLKYIKILYTFVVVLMLFNTQFIYLLANDSPTSISIGQEYVEKYGDEKDKAKFYSNMIIEYDVSSLKWLSKYGCKEKKLFFTGGYTHIGSVYHNMEFFPRDQIYGEYMDCYQELCNIHEYQYIFIMYSNVVKNIGFSMETDIKPFNYFNFSEFKPLLMNRSKIYSNGGSEILFN